MFGGLLSAGFTLGMSRLRPPRRALVLRTRGHRPV